MGLTLVHNIGQLISNAPLVKRGYANGAIEAADLGILNNAWLVLDDHRIQQLGSGTPPKDKTYENEVDAKGGIVLPGLIDSHTHPVFAGNRSHEFCKRLDGATYQEIAAAGGGIKYSIKATREAGDSELLDSLLAQLNKIKTYGITAAEIKSGYGLTVEEELRHLKLMNQAKLKSPIDLYTTALPLHDLTADYPDKKTYIDTVINEFIPQVKDQKLADAFDVFIEDGYYSVEDCEAYVQAVHAHGFDLRIHADEFTDAGAAAAAAKWKAKSADHLQFASETGLKAMAAQKVVATILPGTSLYTKIPFTNGENIRNAGCAIAIASDYNPGSCKLDNLPMLAGLAAIHCKLKAAETLAAVTYNAAYSLGWQDRKGAIIEGYDSDCIVFTGLSAWQDWLADCGQTLPSHVFTTEKA